MYKSVTNVYAGVDTGLISEKITDSILFLMITISFGERAEKCIK